MCNGRVQEIKRKSNYLITFITVDACNFEQVLKSISYLLAVGMTVPISQGSHIGFTSGFLEWKVKTLQVIILQEYA